MCHDFYRSIVFDDDLYGKPISLLTARALICQTLVEGGEVGQMDCGKRDVSVLCFEIVL